MLSVVSSIEISSSLLTTVEENDRDLEASHEGKFILKRMTEFYGLGREEWLQLVVKV